MVHNSEMGDLSGHQLERLSGNSELIKGILGVYTLFQSPSIRGVNIPNKQTERTPGNSPKTPSKMESIPSQMNITPPKTNMEPENDGLEDVSPFPRVYFQVPAVNLPGCILIFKQKVTHSRTWAPRSLPRSEKSLSRAPRPLFIVRIPGGVGSNQTGPKQEGAPR